MKRHGSHLNNSISSDVRLIMRHTKRHGLHLNNIVTVREYNDDIVMNRYLLREKLRSRAFSKFNRVKGLVVFGFSINSK